MKSQNLPILLFLLLPFFGKSQCQVTSSVLSGPVPPYNGQMLTVQLCFQSTASGFPVYSQADWSGLTATNCTINSTTALGGFPVTSAYCVNVDITAGTGGSPLNLGGTINSTSILPPCSVVGPFFSVNVLPVELVEFKGNQSNDNIDLNWTTASETNNSYFTVERSFDGTRFEAVKDIQGAGQSLATINYNFTDLAVRKIARGNTVYYRLKQTDYNGQSSYSEIIHLKIQTNNDFAVNHVETATGNATIYFTLPENKNIQARLFDLNGRLLADKTQEAFNGINSIEFPIDQQGVFMVQLTDGMDYIVSKFIK